MTREEALNRAINIVSYVEAHLAKSKAAREEAVKIIEVLEQELCVTPQPKTGRWKKNKNYDAGEGFYICSNCKTDWYDVGEFSYCPACGAKMQESEGQE